MGPASRALEGILAIVAVGVALAIAVCLFRALRGSRRRRLAWAADAAAAVLVGQLAAVGAASIHVNRQLGLYLDWQSLRDALGEGGGLFPDAAGTGDPMAGLNDTRRRQIADQGWTPHAKQPPSGAGSYRDYIVTGATTGVRTKVIVWVPPGVTTPAQLAKLPVVMVIGGAYVSIDWVVDGLHFAESATPLIASRAVPQFVAVFPDPNVLAPLDSECVDVPGRVMAYSWLAKDVRTWAHEHLGVSLAGASWSAQGWSLGGYCAAKLHATDPSLFHAGASIQGFFEVAPDNTTGPLGRDLSKSLALRQASSVSWLIRNHTPPALLRLLANASTGDPQSYPQLEQFRTRVGPRPGITYSTGPGQGHTLASWAMTQPEVLPFLLGHG